MKPQTTSRHRPGAPPQTARAHRSAIAARRSSIADRPSRSRSFGRSRTRMDAPVVVCCVCMCVHDVSPTSTVHHSHDRAVICHHTTRACAYHENLAASASCFMSTTSSSRQGRRACSTAQPMVGRAEASKRATRAADHLRGTFEPRTEGGWRVEMWFQAGVRRRRGDQDAQTHGSEGDGEQAQSRCRSSFNHETR